MPKNKSLKDILIKKEDEISFLVSSILLLALTPSLIEIITRPWLTNNFLYYQVANFIWLVNYDGISHIANLILGFYSANVLILLADEKKRFQTVILILILIVFIDNLFTRNLFPHIHLELFFVAAGSVVGILFSSDDISKGNVIKDLLKDKREFKRPAKNLAYISFFIIAASFFVYYIGLYMNKEITPNNDVVKDLVIVSTFWVFFKKVMQYETKSLSILILGPKASGKTLFLAGAFLNALEVEGNRKINPNKNLIDLIEEAQRTGWVRRTSEPNEYNFIYRYGTLFPKDIKFYNYDYPGTYLTGIYEFMEDHGILKRNSEDKDIQNSSDLLNSKFYEDAFTSKRIFELLESRIKECDKLIFIIDGSKYPEFTDLGIKEYLKILDFLNKHKIYKDCYIVVTKCDYFLDEYTNNKSRIISDETYDQFKDFINDHYVENTAMKPLLAIANCKFLFPVFYHTVLEDGNRILIRDSYGNIMPPFGYGPLLNHLIK